ncbi:MAG TPA: iron-containing alcohol dehydrogenase [Solirubrobacterales bacterium]|nr:iron-containing alcohol dehydrogenase [Solirubrobacterales bacterium]
MTAFGATQWSGFKDFCQFASPTRVVAGRGLLEGAGFEFAKEGASRALIVTDAGIRATGLPDRVSEGLSGGGVEPVGVFDGVPQDSDAGVVAECAALANELGADSFLALGGGSVIDTAKAADVLFTHGGEIADYEGVYGLPRAAEGVGPPLALAPLAAIPTTAGTGSEVSPVAVVKDADREIKIFVLDFPLAPRLAILDPESTATLPAPIAAATGMDALTHAIEGVTSTEWSPFGDAYALHAIRMIRDNLERAVADTSDEQARGEMLVAANLAIVPTGLGATGITHSLSHPCGARHGVPHGVANAINLPVAIEFNAGGDDGVADRYREIAELVDAEPGGSAAAVGTALADWVRELTARLRLPRRLSEVGVSEESIPQLASDATGEGSTLVNPREPTEEDFAELYRRAL